MKNLGIIFIIVGALLLVGCALLPFMNDMADYNWYTGGSVVLIIAGLLLHIYLKKKAFE